MPVKAGENPWLVTLIDSPVLRNSWCEVFPLRASCSAGRYFTPLLFHVTLTQVKSFHIKINVAICLEQGAADLHMHIHEWLQ